MPIYPAVARRLLGVAMLATLAACAMPRHTDAQAAPPDPYNPAAVQLLDNTDWTLASWRDADGTMHGLPSAPVTLQLSTATGVRRAVGNTGCNRYAGSYQLKNGFVAFGPFAVTRMACLDDSRPVAGNSPAAGSGSSSGKTNTHRGNPAAARGSNAGFERGYFEALAHVAKTGAQLRAPQQLYLVTQDGATLTFAHQQP